MENKRLPQKLLTGCTFTRILTTYSSNAKRPRPCGLLFHWLFYWSFSVLRSRLKHSLEMLPWKNERQRSCTTRLKSSGFALNKLFDPSIFRMNQSVEFSASSFGGGVSSMGMFTNSMMWQFNEKLAARVDMSVAYSPNANQQFNNSSGGLNGNAQVFVRNAEVAYRPSENVQIHLSFSQSPYGYYASPYGYGRGYGYYGSRRFHSVRTSFNLR